MHNMIPPLKDNQYHMVHTGHWVVSLPIFVFWNGMWKETEEPGGQKRGYPDVEIV